jgi:hypothetical protein
MDFGAIKVLLCVIWVFALFLWVVWYLNVQIDRLLPKNRERLEKTITNRLKESRDLFGVVCLGSPYFHPYKSIFIWIIAVLVTFVVLFW